MNKYFELVVKRKDGWEPKTILYGEDLKVIFEAYHAEKAKAAASAEPLEYKINVVQKYEDKIQIYPEIGRL